MSDNNVNTTQPAEVAVSDQEPTSGATLGGNEGIVVENLSGDDADVFMAVLKGDEAGDIGPISPSDADPDAPDASDDKKTEGDKDAPSDADKENPPAQEKEDGEEDKVVERVRLATFDERSRLIIDFLAKHRNEGYTVEEVAEIIDRKHPELAPKKASSETVKAEDGESNDHGGDGAVTLSARIEEMTNKAQEIEAAMEKASDDFDMKEYHALNKQLRGLERQINQLEMERMRAAAAAEREAELRAAQGQSAVDASMQRAIAMYPDLEDVTTEHAVAVQVEIERLKRDNPAVFDDPEWPEAVAAKTAARLGIVPASKTDLPTGRGKEGGVPPVKSVQPNNSAVRPQPPKGAPPGIGRTGSSTSVSARADAAEAEVLAKTLRETNDPEALLEFLRRAGTRGVA